MKAIRIQGDDKDRATKSRVRHRRQRSVTLRSDTSQAFMPGGPDMGGP